MAIWRFPSNDYGENKGINDSGVATFRGTPLKSLAREICQNSLDAARESTVIIDFDMFSIPTDQIPGFEVLKDTFQRCLDFWGGQKAKSTKDFFTNALHTIEKEKCAFMRISDYKTTGLTGSREEINTDWTNLTKSSGASDKKGTAGGSYGIGKFAPFACSDFSTVFYSTLDENSQQAYQGVSRLVTFRREDDETTQGIGYFGNERNTPVYEQLMIQPEYKREASNYGTDIYIAGYKFADDDWQKNIVISVLDGFLGAVWNEKLIVNVGDIVIKKNTLQDLIDAYKDELTGYTDKYYEVLISSETEWDESDFMGLGNIKLGILMGDPDSPKRVGMIRQTGMKIMDKDRLPGHVPFTGIMFIEGDKINERLRSIENPEHTEWQPNRAKNPLKEKELLKALNTYIRKRIEELVSKGSREEIDAAGVGSFLPDENPESPDKAVEEVVSDKVLAIEKNVVNKQTVSGRNFGEIMMNEEDEDEGGHKEQGGSEKEWFHPGGRTEDTNPRDGQEAHTEEGGSDKIHTKIEVALKKFVPVCVDKSKGMYVFMLVPERDGKDGTLEVYLSAETQNYEAPVKKADLIGGGSLTVRDNKIKCIEFKENQPVRIRVQLDYYDYCSMEVKTYAVEK
ncbi:hypothetical protein Q604_UNBC18358G0002 [human gut metagenome]|uniref:Uncharacterized protein n=1 Tax=human gut metagenome TaxID=408170 RepID=W1WT21_9ZZZZ|nr:hypothetical protein [Clostridium butyricum]MDU5821216.1 hypothetical protein [Clostridium butyricum]